jgi:hypothetical protein
MREMAMSRHRRNRFPLRIQRSEPRVPAFNVSAARSNAAISNPYDIRRGFAELVGRMSDSEEPAIPDCEVADVLAQTRHDESR